MIHFICATPLPNIEEFKKQSNLFDYCKSIEKLAHKSTSLNIVFNNRESLGKVYNNQIERLKHKTEDIVVFVHDDVIIEDINLLEKLEQSSFDIIGLAGTEILYFDPPILWHRCPYTPTSNLSGAVAHTDGKQIWQSSFGPFRKYCQVIDGLFIAVKLKRLIKAGVRFDEQFDFHFYDLDFCLTARVTGLFIGTEPIWVVHRGLGEWDKPEWYANQERFIKKWKPKN